jgi:RNA polymerase sigma-70 factor, ECF subfamily
LSLSAVARFAALTQPRRPADRACTTQDSEAVANPSGEELLALIAEGDRGSLSTLFHRYARLVRSVALRILRDDSEADDLLQDIFLFIHRKAGTFDPGKCSARSWIVQMAYHRAIDRRRELQSRHFYSQVALSGGVEVMDQHAKTNHTALTLKEVVGNTTMEGLFDTLTEDQRNTLSLHFYEGYTFAEIAEKLGQSLGNIRHHYYRGLERLREQIFKGKVPGRTNGHDGQGKK